jgi:hypothetical protein
MAASLGHSHWSTHELGQRRQRTRDVIEAERATDAALGGAHVAAEPPGYAFTPCAQHPQPPPSYHYVRMLGLIRACLWYRGSGVSLQLQDGYKTAVAAAAAGEGWQPIPRPRERPTADWSRHEVLWSEGEPWGSTRYADTRAAVHDVRATPGARAVAADPRLLSATLTRRGTAELEEMRRLVASWGLPRGCCAALERGEPRRGVPGCRSVEGLLDVRRPQLERAGMSRPQVRAFERAAAELAREHIGSYYRGRTSGAAAGRGGGGGASAAASTAVEGRAGGLLGTARRMREQQREDAVTEAASRAAAVGERMRQFEDAAAELEERHRYLSGMRRLGRGLVSRDDEARLRHEMRSRLATMQQLGAAAAGPASAMGPAGDQEAATAAWPPATADTAGRPQEAPSHTIHPSLA